MSTTRTVARNSMWFGLEMAFGTVATIVISILVARHFGPERLGLYNFVLWLTYVAGVLGSVGIPATTAKYMGEYWGKGERAMAYRIFRTALQTQILVASVVVVIVWIAVWYSVPREFLPVASVMVVAIWPRLVAFIPSQANIAQENVSANLPGAVSGTLIQFAVILATLQFGWDLMGMAASHLVSFSVEMVIKLWPLLGKAWAGDVPPIDRELRARMIRFSTQGMGLMLLSVLVWDRFDLVLLKTLSSDVRQLTFFSLSFTLVDKLLMLPQSLSSAMGATLMAQYGRDRTRVAPMAVTSTFYLLLTGLPVLLGAVAVSEPLWKIYGERYSPAVPVFSVMASLAAARLFLMPAQSILQVTENQGFLVWWGVVSGVVNLAIDALLIPGSGAMGAALGNGVGRALMAAGAWFRVWQLFRLDLQPRLLMKLLASSAMMTGSAMWAAHQFSAGAGAVAGILTGALVYVAMLRWTGALGDSDRDRLLSLSLAMPRLVRLPFQRILLSVVPQQAR